MIFKAMRTLSSLWLLLSTSSAADTEHKSGYPGLSFHFPRTNLPHPFEVRVDPSFLKLTLQKVRGYRRSPSVHSDWTIEGAPEKAMVGLARHWGQDYNWRAVENTMNREFRHYVTTVPGNRNFTAPIPLHFIHERSADSNAMPLLLLHGWSSTHHEWLEVIKPLARGNGGKSFHIVAPDLPGFGFSPSPTIPGLGPREMGIAFDAMMKQLGYSTYGIVTTDIGWSVGMWMTEDVRNSIAAHFTDFFLVSPERSDLARQANNQTTEEENTFIATMNEWYARHAAYATAQTQKPLALALAMTDSPVGFAGWLWDLKETNSDGYAYSYDEVITDTMLMWIQGPYGGIRAYMEMLQPDALVYPKTDVPTGITQWGNLNGPFPKIAKLGLAPRHWVERAANVVYFSRYEIGGHYPAISQTELWIENLRAFFSSW